MAEKAAAPAAEAPSAPSGGQGKGPKPILFIILAIINMAVVMGVGFMLYSNNKKAEHEPNVKDVATENAKQDEEQEKKKEFIGKIVPLETFFVNLSGTRGRKLLKVAIQFEVNNDAVQEEIEKIKPKIRDYIIIIVSSKTFSDIATKEGKDSLREEIKSQVNLFLTKGQIKEVYFGEFITN